jgi:pantoate--beta-alanine ligase
MHIITDNKALTQQLADWRAQQACIALIPTMGALHAGHMSLVKAASALQNTKIILSIFVNPTQFGPQEDFANYPRTHSEDAALAKAHGVDAIWLPKIAEIYPDGFATSVRVEGVSRMLCGLQRVGHFDGVATIVTKLLMQTQPDTAFFGEKDFQQLAIVKRLVADLHMPVRIQGVATMREKDGLALSSRNRYLNDDQRNIAPVLYRVLQNLASQIKTASDTDIAPLIAQAKQALSAFDRLEYLEYVDAQNLMPLARYQPDGGRLCAAVHLGNTRLIDNIEV